MRIHSLARPALSGLILSVAFVASSLGLTAPAAAQSSYAVKELTSPQGLFAGSNPWYPQFLSDNGDAFGVAAYVYSYGWVYTGFGFKLSPSYKYRLVSWRGGNAPVIVKLRTGEYIDPVTIWGTNAAGEVLVRVFGGPSETRRWLTSSTDREWPALNRLPDEIWRFEYSRPSPDGKVALCKTDAALEVLVASGTDSLQALPRLPGANATLDTCNGHGGSRTRNMVIDDKGQVAAITREPRPSQDALYRTWFWNGTTWTQITPDAAALGAGVGIRSIGALSNITPGGRVAFSVGTDSGPPSKVPGYGPGRVFIWNAQTGWQGLPPEIGAAKGGTLRVNDAGEVVGEFEFPQATEPSRTESYIRPGIWRQGRLLDLNTLATPPAGYYFSDLIGANAKGQLLVQGRRTSGAEGLKYWLLTPQP